MINAICITNLDGYRFEQWPSVFIDVPQIGHYVRAISGVELYVCAITHFVVISTDMDPPRETPFIEVELTKRTF